jgi:hypothetical protein
VLKLKFHVLLSTSAFEFLLRHYTVAAAASRVGAIRQLAEVGWRRLTASTPVLKAPMVSALETMI